MPSSVLLSYSDDKPLPENAPKWAVSATERIREKLAKGIVSELQPPESVKNILLHSCCAPCSGAMVEEMMNCPQIEKVTVFFYNPYVVYLFSIGLLCLKLWLVVG